ncbi:MAG: S8 family serine peptidase [Candidatus Methanoperedens sp.]
MISAKTVQSDVKDDLLNEHMPAQSNEKISPTLDKKIANTIPEDDIPVIIFMKKSNKITSKMAVQSLVSSTVESNGGKVGHKYKVIDAFSAKMPAAKISMLSRMPEVEKIYYDQIVSLPPHPLPETGILMTRSTQTIGANYVWNTFGYTGTGIKVAIIDTGINYNHPDLGGGFGPGKKVADGYDFVNNDAFPMDDNGHGTHVAGIVAANGGIIGVAPGATLFAVKVLDSAGSGSTSNVIAGIDWSIAHGANVISMSLGGSGQPNDEFADVLNIISDAAVDKGVVVVIAAGNEGPGTGTVGAPGSAKKVITVGASSSSGTVTISDDTIASFSNRGPSAFGRLDPEVVAPGVAINSTWLGSGYNSIQGTSMATPMVSGSAALLLQKNPALTPAQVRAILMNTASNLTASNYHVFEKGAGIINLTNAFTYNISAVINGDDRWEESVIPGFSTIGRLVLNNNNIQPVNFTFSLEAITDLERDNSIPVSSFNLPVYEIVNAGSSKTINITFTPPTGVKPGIFGTTLIATNSTFGTLRIPVVITIPLMGSGSIQGTVNNADTESGDWIYYKLKSYNGTTLKAYLNWTDSSDDLDLFLYAPNGALAASSGLGSGVSEVVTLSNMVYDEYWLAVHAYTLSGSGSYYLNVSYPLGSKGKLEVNPSLSQSVIASNEIKNITFLITNDATAKSGLSLNVKKLMAGGNDFSSGTIGNTGSLYTKVWDVSGSGMNLNNTRYMNVTLQWVNPANDLDILLAYYTGTQWKATRFGSAQNNPQLNQAWEKLDYIDIQYYLKSYPDFGIYVQNNGSLETYNLTLNFTDTAAWGGASVNETSMSLSSGQTRQVNVTINGSQLTQDVTDLVFTIQDSTEDYAVVPIRINSGISSQTDTTAPSSITNLNNITYTQTHLNWTWTDPQDADFSKVMIYLDGSFKTNVTKGVTYYNATGLTAGTTHTIATRTVDTIGNINTTWVNHTSITASVPDTIAPSSITSLHNITYSQTHINWTWTDSTDTDFSKVMIYLDGSFKTNVTKGVKYYNATGLTAGSTHTIATRTVDTIGNINTTWVNHTSITASVPDTIAPSSITSLHNITYSQTHINWTWTDSTDTDFSKVMIYLDGSFKTNVTKGVQYYNATGLTAGTMHTIATRTVDTIGNINTTWVNHTVTTSISTVATAPSLIFAITPNSRNAQVGTPVTLFLSVINYGTATATDVSITQASSLPATVNYQQWNNIAFTGSPNTPVDMPADSTANFVITINATSAFDSSSMTFNVSGTNVAAALISAVNTLTNSASVTPSADVIMMSTSLDVSTAVNTPTVFAVATSNVGGASATDVSLILDIPSTISGLVYQLNETHPANGTIKGPATGLNITVGAQPTFAVFLIPTQPIAYDPANNRITLQLVDSNGKIIGAQSVAVSTTHLS